MVKFRIPGDSSHKVFMGGHAYTGGVVYDNNLCKVPENQIIPFIINENKQEEEPANEPSPPPTLAEPETPPPEEGNDHVLETLIPQPEEDAEALKQHIKTTMTVVELKEECSKLGLKGYSKLKEDALISLLISNGFRG